jgi:V/A-type H+/Na+-transporting ATPase subunit E
MGLEEMLNSIRTDTEAQHARTISDAKAEAEKIISEARQRAQAIIEQRRIQSQKELQEERLRSIASARLEAKRRLLTAKDEVLRKYEDEAFRYLKDFAKSSMYEDFLFKMVNDGVAKIGAGAIVQVNPSDKKLLENSSMGDFQISEKTIDSIGGAIISSQDGKRRVDNTLESIFEERKDDLTLQLSDQIFGKQEA